MSFTTSFTSFQCIGEKQKPLGTPIPNGSFFMLLLSCQIKIAMNSKTIATSLCTALRLLFFSLCLICSSNIFKSCLSCSIVLQALVNESVCFSKLCLASVSSFSHFSKSFICSVNGVSSRLILHFSLINTCSCFINVSLCLLNCALDIVMVCFSFATLSAIHKCGQNNASHTNTKDSRNMVVQIVRDFFIHISPPIDSN